MEHSTLVGGSTADRRIGCPASFQEENKVPAHIRNKSSEYADEGTALHAAMQFIMENNIFEEDLEEQILGKVFEGYEMTQEYIDKALLPCMDYIELLMEEYKDEGEFIFETETRCQMPGIPGAFGTTDFIFRTSKRSGIIDYKFGEGVLVKAFYIEEDGSKRGNSQGLYYGRAAAATIPHMFEDRPDWPIEIHILQPRARNTEHPYSTFETDMAGLEKFRQGLIVAIEAAQGKNPQHRKGPWCRFAACKTVCPLHTGALLDLSKVAAIKAVKPEALDWDKHMHMLLEMAEIGDEIITAIYAQAHAHLENGGNILGPDGERSYKLVPKNATERVVDEPGMIQHAKKAGLADADIYKPKEAKSPAQLGTLIEPLIDTTAFKTKKARTEEARRQLRDFTVTASSGTKLAPFSDGRPEVRSTPQLVADYSAKLALLQQK